MLNLRPKAARDDDAVRSRRRRHGSRPGQGGGEARGRQDGREPSPGGAVAAAASGTRHSLLVMV